LFRHLLPLIVSSGNVDTSVVPGHIQGALFCDQSEPNATDKRKVNAANPSLALSAPSISHGVEYGGATLPTFSQSLPVTVASGTTDDSPVLGCGRELAKSSTHALNPGAAFEHTSNRKSAVSTTANAILRGVKESSSAYPPLKSVARHLCVVLASCEVRSPSHTFDSRCSQLCQGTEVNERAIEWLAPRIRALSESLSAPIPADDVVGERGRENKLER
jgi:hypothetical protein